MVAKKGFAAGNGLKLVLTKSALAVMCFAIAFSTARAEEAAAEPAPAEDGSGFNPEELPNYTNTVEGRDGIILELEPLPENHFDENRVTVHFKYRVRGRGNPPGSAEVRLRNRTTGETFKKKFPVPYSMGEHFEWAACGGEGKGTSTKASDLDALLFGELIEDDEIPDGFYIPDVTLFAAGCVQRRDGKRGRPYIKSENRHRQADRVAEGHGDAHRMEAEKGIQIQACLFKYTRS